MTPVEGAPSTWGRPDGVTAGRRPAPGFRPARRAPV